MSEASIANLLLGRSGLPLLEGGPSNGSGSGSTIGTIAQRS
jgi:hypothetical protein